MASNIPEKREHANRRSGGLVEKKHKTHPRYVPYGQIAFASAYAKLDELAAQQGEAQIIRELQGRVRRYVVEVNRTPQSGSFWVTASRAMQGRNLDEAKRLVAALPGYRIMVEDRFGNLTQRLRVEGH